MDQLIDLIRIAITNGAPPEQKAAGAQACRTIIAALDTEPGKPLMPPAAPATATRPTLDQMLDLVIARLTTIANAQDTATAPPAPKKVSPAASQVQPSPATPIVSAVPRQLPASLARGLRVPAAVAPPRPVARRANASQIRQTSSAEFKTAHPTPTKHPNTPTRKP